MLKTFLTATAISGLMFSSALAQAPAPTPPAASPAPSATAPAPKAEATLPADAAAKFVSAQSSGHWVASKFKGTDVLGPNNEHIGDVDDLVFDKSGKIVAFVVGVGGFLGIGEKNVALAPDAFQVVSADAARTSAAGTGANTGTTTTAASTSAADDPNNVKLKVSWTKDQLKSAPAFEYYRAAARTTGAGTGANTGMDRPATPAR
jgi:hypothetical protein